jgi:hypothetical protein
MVAGSNGENSFRRYSRAELTTRLTIHEFINEINYDSNQHLPKAMKQRRLTSINHNYSSWVTERSPAKELLTPMRNPASIAELRSPNRTFEWATLRVYEAKMMRKYREISAMPTAN